MANRYKKAQPLNGEPTSYQKMKKRAEKFEKALRSISVFFVCKDGNCGGRAVEIAREALS